MTTQLSDSVLWFSEVACQSVEIAGGKGASLASLTNADLPVPPGFIVPATALEQALAESGHHQEVQKVLADIRSDDDAQDAAEMLQSLVLDSPVTGTMAQEIGMAYAELDAGGGVAVRSSACAEDGESASYAGQQETFLNVKGDEQVLRSVSACWASFFGTRALFYRRLKGSLSDLGMAVVVQHQLNADKAGVMFTIDPVRRRRDQMLIEAAYGLGEAVVSGAVIPDQYLVSRTGDVKKVRKARQQMMVVRRPDGGTEEVELDDQQASRQVLDESDLQTLVKLGAKTEEIFGGPQDVEWAFEDGELYLLQSRPVTA
ncbi:MAG: phosphoenolpyruvate synthase [Acidimicrobiia bacterium]|nr:phosphoenolpyruvate synthase [Acidimicrobiia bacterium]